MAEVDRAEILAYAEQHGATAAGEHYDVAPSTIRSWRHRAAQAGGDRAADAPAVAPGDDDWQVARLEIRANGHEAARCGGEIIASALSEARSSGLQRARDTYGVPERIIAAWAARDAGREPSMGADEALDRLRYAFSSLPDDVRIELAKLAEENHWAYHALDVEHFRIRWARQHQERAEAAEQARAEQAAAAEAEAAEQREREAAEQAERERAAERAARAKAERERAAAEAEALRRASEQARRAA